MKFSAAGYLALLSALGTAFAANSNVVSPLQDDFYKAPSGFESKKPGEVLKSREIQVDTLEVQGNIEKMYQIMYRTTSSLNNATYAVTSLLVPKNANSKKLLSFQTPEDANYVGCAPSYTLRTSDDLSDGIGQALNNSIIVSSPDYEGPNSAFTAGILSGHATLDSIRAVLNFKDNNLDKNPNIAMWGYSGGSVATGWANQLQPAYAPELKIAGAAMGGVVANISAVALHVNGGTDSGFVPAGLLGLATEYPELNKIIDENLFAQNKSEIMKVRGQCVTQDLIEFLGQDIFSYFKDGDGLLDLPQVQAIIANLTMGENAPGAPAFIYEGQKDEVVPIAIVEKAVKDYCSHDNVDILFITDPETDHLDTAANAQNVAFQWLNDRLDGKAVSKGCSSTTTVFNPAVTSYPGRLNSNSTANVTSSATKSTSATSTAKNAAVPVKIDSGAFAAVAVAVAALL
ncbi:hypothetical protein TRVA0_005S03400 [Trichomonascus vanleenenianus]|uniref:uncharacterized protein n=1 Tax=Trichomonascus vanleenenianus TaxID=2268995 RepID=UPI003ECA2EAA